MSFADYYASCCEKADQRLDKMAVEYLWKRGDSVMDCIAKLINLR